MVVHNIAVFLRQDLARTAGARYPGQAKESHNSGDHQSNAELSRPPGTVWFVLEHIELAL